MAKERYRLVDLKGLPIIGEIGKSILSTLRTIGIPRRVRTIRIDLRGHNLPDSSALLTARPAQRGRKPIVESLEIHLPTDTSRPTQKKI